MGGASRIVSVFLIPLKGPIKRRHGAPALVRPAKKPQGSPRFLQQEVLSLHGGAEPVLMSQHFTPPPPPPITSHKYRFCKNPPDLRSRAGLDFTQKIIVIFIIGHQDIRVVLCGQGQAVPPCRP